MKTFEQQTAPRVEKIIHMIEVIRKSARSQKIAPEVLEELLSPVRGELGGGTGATGAPPPARATESAPQGRTGSHWDNLLEGARKAPLEKAIDVMQVILSRIEQEHFEAKRPQ